MMHVKEDISGSISNGRHTFNELYARCDILFALVIEHSSNAWKTKANSEGVEREGYFLAGCEVNGQLLAAWLPMSHWEDCHAEEVNEPPQYCLGTDREFRRALEYSTSELSLL